MPLLELEYNLASQKNKPIINALHKGIVTVLPYTRV